MTEQEAIDAKYLQTSAEIWERAARHLRLARCEIRGMMSSEDRFASELGRL